MKERLITFTAPEVLATLEGRKTQKRFVVKPQPVAPWFRIAVIPGDLVWRNRDGFSYTVSNKSNGPDGWADKNCPWGVVGDRLRVRETWDFRIWSDTDHPRRIRVTYAADGEQRDFDAPTDWKPTLYNYERWRPSIHMPRWMSRITLEVVSVRVERLAAICVGDCHAEGITSTLDGGTCEIEAFAHLWDSINGKSHPWASNPWVLVRGFKQVEDQKK